MTVAYTDLKPQTGKWIPGYEMLGPNRTGWMQPSGFTILDRVDLHYQDGSSDKIYICILSQEGQQFFVQGYYGRRGNYQLTQQLKYEGPLEAAARKEFDKLVLSKTKKQYQTIGSAASQALDVDKSNKSLFSERIVWPMASKTMPETKKEEYINSPDWIAEEKIDGVRLTLHLTPNGPRLFGRHAGVDDPTVPLEKTQAFSYLKNWVVPDKFIGSIIDTEVVADGLDSAQVSGLIGALDGRDTSMLYFKCFDLIQEASINMTPLEWKHRRMKLTNLLEELALASHGTMIKQTGIGQSPVVSQTNKFDEGLLRLTRYTIRDKEKFHYDIVANNGEGTMWKRIDTSYKEGAAPANHWFKWKKSDTADVVIIGFTDAKPGKYVGLIGAVRYAEFLTEEEVKGLGIKKPHTEHMYKDGQDYYLVEIGQCSGMTDEQRRDFTANQGAYLGRVMEVEYMERTKKGALRHPRFLHMRDEKGSRDCIYSNQK